jgi:uncharacterized membrane protein YczE
MNKEQKERRGGSMEFESLQLMGAFLGFFGLIVAAAMVIPDTWTGRIADLAAGVVLMGIGTWAFLKGRSHRKS